MSEASRTLFSSGWRPSIGWICTIGLALTFVISPVVQWVTGSPGPAVPIDSLLELVIALLGMGALRTFEKLKGKAK